MKSVELLTKVLGEVELMRAEVWNQEYEGLLMAIIPTGQTVRSRLAKRTPKKDGYFVAFWQKNKLNQNEPFNLNDSPDILAIAVLDGSHRGIFVIPKEVAAEKGILSTAHKTGKMAMRFYPPWCQELNPTASRTQKWQVAYFKELTN